MRCLTRLLSYSGRQEFDGVIDFVSNGERVINVCSTRRDIFCCITACNESESEITLSIDSFSKTNISSESLRNRLHLFILLDRQPDHQPDTPTYIALKKLLGISVAESDRSSSFIKKNGCRVFQGFIDDIPYSLYVKGDQLLSGKRYSVLLFADIAHRFYPDVDPPLISSLLFLDADTRTDGGDIQYLVNELEADPSCGGVTGFLGVENTSTRNIVVVLQEFYYYFYAHTFCKAADTVFDKCIVLPGAFSLIRYTAFRECLAELSQIPRSNDLNLINRLELGEDRYMTTLLISKQYSTKFIHQATAKTVIPNTLNAFITQQRRWNQSALSNDTQLLFQAKSRFLKLKKAQFIQWITLFIEFVGIWISAALFSLIAAQGWYYHISSSWIAIALCSYFVFLGFTFMNRAVDEIQLWIRCNIILLTLIWNYGIIAIIISAILLRAYLILGLALLVSTLLFFLIIRHSERTERNRLFYGLTISSMLRIPLLTLIYLYTFANLDNHAWGTREISQDPAHQIASQESDRAFEAPIYVRGSSQWQAAQQQKPGSLTGFQKKLLTLCLFFGINLILVGILVMFNSSGETNRNLEICFSILIVSSLLDLLLFVLSSLYYRQFGSDRSSKIPEVNTVHS